MVRRRINIGFQMIVYTYLYYQRIMDIVKFVFLWATNLFSSHMFHCIYTQNITHFMSKSRKLRYFLWLFVCVLEMASKLHVTFYDLKLLDVYKRL